MKIVALVYNGLTALDVVGPLEVLARLPGATTMIVSPGGRPIRTDTGALSLAVDGAVEQLDAADVLLVPGGPMTGALGTQQEVATALARVHASSRVTASVCTGSLILAAAGVFKGVRATTHWSSFEELTALGATPVRERVVVDGKCWSAAGVSSGIDMALQLAAMLNGVNVAQTLQLALEYAPTPPFDAGTPKSAPPEIVEQLRTRFRDLAAAERN